jgi:pimeloyl-ACP methyl ester carboxylesterase
MYLTSGKNSAMSKKWLLAIPVLLLAVYVSGPAPASATYISTMPRVPSEPAALETYIKQQEAVHKLKPDNEARIVWANDSLKEKTEYAIVYLHGFSACQEEGNPTHRNIAAAFGCNLYLSRLAEHGIDTSEPMMNLTADNYWASAQLALAIGKQLGKKVILMGTSTGGTNALQLAAAYPGDVYALLLLSPNIAINNDKAYLLNNHWGLQLAKWVTGHDHNEAKDTRPVYKQYWYYRYPFNGTAALEELLETSMNPETYTRVTQPTLMLYYYKDSVHQDSVVRVDAMLKMFDQLGTATNLKHKQAMPNAGDHVMGSWIKSGDLPGVKQEIYNFMTGTLKMQPVSNNKK